MAATPKITTTIHNLGLLIAGIEAHQPNALFAAAGKSVPAATVIATLKEIVAAYEARLAAHGRMHEAVLAARTLIRQDRALVRDVRQNIQMLYGSAAGTLVEYGLEPRKMQVLTEEQKVLKATRAKATRLARHTMGKRQKARIKAP